MGASLIVCEVDPVKACDAMMNGCRVMPLMEACKEADVVLSVTGVRHTIRLEHFKVLKDNALLANAGHFWEEIDVEGLSGMSKDRKQMRTNVEGFLLKDGRWLNLLGNGNIVNIACADGHPAEIMDTSFYSRHCPHSIWCNRKNNSPSVAIRYLKGSIREWHKSGSSLPESH